MSFAIDNAALGYNNIKVIGVGGAGGNAVNNMVNTKIVGVETIAANTDRQILETNVASHKILLGEKVTQSMGAGGDPSVGKRAADESKELIAEALRGTDMLFIVAGMGGGTGTGAAPIVGEIAKELGILTVAIVTKPFFWEGKRRSVQAEDGIENLEQYVDSIITIPNDRLALIGDKALSAKDAYMAADDILCKGVKSIAETITKPGYINLDFADIRSVMKNGGRAHMGIGISKGADCGAEAVKQAISSPLLENDITGATGVIINITSSPDIPLEVIQQAGMTINELTSPDCNVIFGHVLDESMGDEVSVTIIATGYDKTSKVTTKSQRDAEKAAEAAMVEESAQRFSQMAPDQSKVTISVDPTPVAPSRSDAYADELFGDIDNKFRRHASAPIQPVEPAPVVAPPVEEPIFAPIQPQESSFIDDDDDEDDLPVFKARNLFDQ